MLTLSQIDGLFRINTQEIRDILQVLLRVRLEFFKKKNTDIEMHQRSSDGYTDGNRSPGRHVYIHGVDDSGELERWCVGIRHGGLPVATDLRAAHA